ncbi:PH domain-containing protein [Streptomyces sp. NPDC096339]|uniref:PH domain-containing protein n=1 Tax=Streptomyces sp. NPDC096339 TaxID=3366086 RepID=UPI0037F4D7E2
MESASPNPIPPQTLHRPGQRIALFMLGGACALAGAATLTAGGATGAIGVVIYVAVFAGGVWTAYRSCVMGVRIDAAGLTERGLGRSKYVPWCAIGSVETGDGPGLAPARAPGLILKSGEQVGLGVLASYSSRTVHADLALIKSLHAAHVAGCHGCG